MLDIREYILCDPHSMTYWKRLHYRDREKMSGTQRSGGREGDQVECTRFKPTEHKP